MIKRLPDMRDEKGGKQPGAEGVIPRLLDPPLMFFV